MDGYSNENYLTIKEALWLIFRYMAEEEDLPPELDEKMRGIIEKICNNLD